MREWTGILVPCIIGMMVLRGRLTGTDAYGAFLQGGESGLKAAVGILPALCGMFLMLEMLHASGLTRLITGLAAPAARLIGLPEEVLPLLLLRPLTGSGSLAALEEIFLLCGVDSRAGRLASVLMGSSETIFYTVSVYMGATDFRRLPWAIPISLLAYAAGAGAALMMV